MDERELPVIQSADGVPHALVFAGAPHRSLTPAEAKRARYVQGLRHNYNKLKEALLFVEHFAVICELSDERLRAIRTAKDEALAEVSRKFETKLKAYDARIEGGGS